ncbi:MAG: choice-of-anchor Q domain-containing protein [Nonlabens sp.]
MAKACFLIFIILLSVFATTQAQSEFDMPSGVDCNLRYPEGDFKTSKKANDLEGISTASTAHSSNLYELSSNKSSTSRADFDVLNTEDVFLDDNTINPIADFIFSPEYVSVYEPVTFTDRSSFPDTWFWELGDGTTRTRVRNFSKSYASPGEYVITLTVSDTMNGAVSSKIGLNKVKVYGNNIYVDQNAAGNNNGTSWTDAFNDLQDALTAAAILSNKNIFIATGNYKPTSGTDRLISFRIPSNVSIYGGFSLGNGAIDLATRDFRQYETILNGNINDPDTDDDNTRRVVIISDMTNILIDGVTVSGGASSNGESGEGGGIFVNNSTYILNNLIVQNNRSRNGAGLMNSAGSSGVVKNSIFKNNYSWSNGGAVYFRSGSMNITNCLMENNEANLGAGVYVGLAISISNTTITNNRARNPNGGGGLFIEGSRSNVLRNSIVYNNLSAGNSDLPESSIGFFRNSLISMSNSLIANSGGSGLWNTSIGGDGGNNIDTDPRFINQAGGDYSLRPFSPAIDAGNNAFVSESKDLAGNLRIIDGDDNGTTIVDMGAYEHREITFCDYIPTNILYVDQSAIGSNDGSNWGNAYTKLQDAIRLAENCNLIDTIYVAQGTYYSDEGIGQIDNDRNSNFRITRDVILLGGFPTGGGTLAERDWEANPVVLSGEIQQDIDDTNNSYHIMELVGLSNESLINGFTITKGYANGASPNNQGGGIRNFQSSVNLANLKILSNFAFSAGGVFNDGGNINISNSLIEGNFAFVGAGVTNWDNATAILDNLTISNNRATNDAAGVYNYLNSSSIITNCIIWNNFRRDVATHVAASIDNEVSSFATITNSLIDNSGGSGSSWESSMGTDGGNNLDTDPFFIDLGSYNYRLQSISPAIDSGTGVGITAIYDLANNPRVTNGNIGSSPSIDMGAYEFIGLEPTAVCQDIIVPLDTTGNATITAEDLNNESTDPDGTFSMSIDRNNFDCAAVGPNLVTLTITDNNGNTSFCAATVTVVDTTAPVPDLINLPAIGMAFCELESFTAPTATDSCSGIITATTTTTLPITSDQSLTWIFTDDNGNTTTQNQEIVLSPESKPCVATTTFDGVSWSNGVPDTSTSAIIAGDYNLGSITCCSLTINEGITLNLGDNSIISSGSIINNGMLLASSGTIEFNSSCRVQTLEGNDFQVGDLIVDYAGTQNVSITNGVEIINRLDLQNGILDTSNGSLKFKSTANNTAIVDEVLTGTILGEVTVERYIPGKRAFRMVSSSVTTTTSINTNWQEGVNNQTPSVNLNPNPNYGIHITGSQTGTNGFDATDTGNPSMFGYNNVNQFWTTMTNTNATNLTAGTPYRLFVRGSREVDLSTNTVIANATILRAKGTLQTGDFTINSLGMGAGAFSFIGNPYQASVDMNSVLGASTNLNTSFYYLWDPQMGQRGAYATIMLPSGTNTSGSEANQYLQPGQAAFVTTEIAGAAALLFAESHKAPGELTATFSTPSNSSSIIGQLFRVQNGSMEDSPQDSFGIFFDSAANNGVDASDALKLINQDETIAIQYGINLLAVDNRQLPAVSEMIVLNHTSYRTDNYRYAIDINNVLGRRVYLEDIHFGTLTALSDGINHYDFNIDEQDGSDASNRFSLRFENQTLGLDKIEESLSFQMIPNPVIGDIVQIISMNQFSGDDLIAKIYNLTGQKLFELSIHFVNGKAQITGLSQLTTGAYFMTIYSKGFSQTIKFIKK